MKAVIFDIDGTLLDTTEYIYQAFENSLKTHGYPLISRADMSHTIGESLEDCYRAFCGAQDVARLIDTHHVFQLEHPYLPFAYNTVKETLHSLKKQGIQIGALTSRSAETVQDTLEDAGIGGYIAHVLTLDDVVHHKPDPEGIYKHLNYFGIAPEQAMMVGDSPVDVLAGKNAGVKTVGVTYGFHGNRILESDPDYVIDDIGEIVRLVAKS